MLVSQHKYIDMACEVIALVTIGRSFGTTVLKPSVKHCRSPRSKKLAGKRDAEVPLSPKKLTPRLIEWHDITAQMYGRSQ